MESHPKKLRTATEKGALWHEYDFLVHQFVAHLRRVHPSNKAIMMEIPSAGKVSVKAADPLAKPEIPLYYTHSKTHLYNDIFFHFWDNVMTPTLGNICPWMSVTSKKSLEQLFDFKFDRFVLFFWLVLYKIKFSLEKRTGCKAFRLANEKCLDGPSNYCETTVVLNGIPKT